ncbi:TonB-dependent receptor [Dyadobacter sp. CY356]|uniref:TonB-dependent receptor n=1 Tax=Dyadobacter sp. CY356 TaxID=2906442 RepID=UPI001F3ED28C|nr:TonB-dependent receptor [Dyadobacter sp. CY356]MCF0056301.1 TonB-dependent receptor [Dyadobacter sp. CY356]
MRSDLLKILFLIAGIIFHLNTKAQVKTDNALQPTENVKNILTGKIINSENGEILPGASVIFPDLKIGGSTNVQGMYSFKNLPEGKYLIEITFVGFSSILETIELKGNMTKDFKLSPTAVEAEAVTITGVSSATSVKRTPIPVTIIKKQDFNRGTSTNIIDALTKIPGVSQISTGAAISKPVIRGLGYNRLVVVNDGIRQEGQQWGDEHGVEIDEYSINRAEVLKGPASIMYGSDALAGVINFTSIETAAEGEINGNILTTYQSNNNLRGVHGEINGNKNGLVWGLNGTYKAAADYKNKYDGKVFNSNFNEKNFGTYIGLNKSWGFTHLYLTRFDQTVGLIEGDRDEVTGKFTKVVNNNGTEEEVTVGSKDDDTSNPVIPYQKIKHFKLATDNSFYLGNNRLAVTVAYQRNRRQEFGNVLDPGEKALYFDLSTINYNIRYHFSENNGWKNSVGINGMQQTNRNKGVEALIPEYALFDAGVFFYSQKRIDKLTISGGIRFDSRFLNSNALYMDEALKFESFKRNFSNVSASGGLSYALTKAATLKFNIARGFRAPNIPELASNGAHEGTNRYVHGQQNLKSETSLQLDGGIEMSTSHLTLSAYAFYNSISNFIYYRKLVSGSGSDSIVLDGNEKLIAYQYAQNKANLYGGELGIDIHPHPLDWLHIQSSFSYVRATLGQKQDGSKNLPLIPAGRLINTLKAEFGKNNKKFRNAYLKLELDNTFAQNHPFTGFNTETKTAGYGLLNAGLGGDLVARQRTFLSIFLSANNITDVAYQNHLSRLKYTAVNAVTGRMGVFNMGRNFSVKVIIPFKI